MDVTGSVVTDMNIQYISMDEAAAAASGAYLCMCMVKFKFFNEFRHMPATDVGRRRKFICYLDRL